MRGPIHLPAAVRKAQPWKNGGGRTTTIVEEPPGVSLEGLDWRISIADIDTPGPFSLFPGMTRHLLVLEGSVRLVGREVNTALGMAEGAFTFSGDTEIHATPLTGATRVVNVMVRRDRFGGALRRTDPGSGPRQYHIAIYVAEKPTIVTIAGQDYHLLGEDGLMLTEPAKLLLGSNLIAVDLLCKYF